ncbi:MAG: cytochrome c [SAR202 cluster bacterium]|nr:cytochrome c [SAR202 cluster bacterium]|tara:strand:- start:37225 stop:37863 length:639 start_codon:yes stop_codon:yes gene_type:complete
MNKNKTHIILFIVSILTVLSTLGCVSYNSVSGVTTVRGVGSFDLPVIPKTGSHKVMVFSEMHYQQSYRSQEGPRLLPPNDSVPITGKEISYNSLEEYQELSMPKQFISNYNQDHVKEVYRVNCLVCHGQNLDGNGSIVPFIDKGPLPVNLLEASTQNAKAGEVFAFISYGGRQGFSSHIRNRESASPMPSFKYLLSEKERWDLVKYIQSIND